MQITIQHIPTDLREFEALAAEGRRPEELCALLLCALVLFDRDKAAGTAALDRLRGPRPMTPYDTQFLRDRLRGKPYLICPWRILKALHRKTVTVPQRPMS